MKIALYHNYYTMRGGEDEVFEMECRELERLGHEVVTYTVHNDKVLAGKSIFGKARLAWDSANNRESYIDIFEFLSVHRPDVGHVHNWFPVISPAIYDAHEKLGVPVVQTLHNYRLGCANGTMRREGQDCEKCVVKGNWNAVSNRCYRNSCLGSLAWKRTVDNAWKSGTVTEKVDQYICPSQEVSMRHEKMGIPKEKLSVVWNACEDPLLGKVDKPETPNKKVVFLGRLVAEKGVDMLINAWKEMEKEPDASISVESPRLTIIGDGDCSEELKSLADGRVDIEFTGQLPHDQAMEKLVEASVLVFPSRWAEPFGLGIIEAMAAGKVVIASNVGAPKEIISNGVDGVLVSPEDPKLLAKSLTSLLSDPNRIARIGKAARLKFEKNFNVKIHAERLIDVYEQAILKKGITAQLSN